MFDIFVRFLSLLAFVFFSCLAVWSGDFLLSGYASSPHLAAFGLGSLIAPILAFCLIR